MRIGPDRVLACPSCGAIARAMQLFSGNSIGARVWTDGKVDAPMLPDLPRFARCSDCRAFYDIAAAPLLGTLFADGMARPRPLGDAAGPRWKAAPLLLPLAKADLVDALALTAPGELAADREARLYLLIKALHAANDPLRTDPAAAWSADDRARAEALLALLDRRLQPERIIAAELLRALGRFAEALALLALPLRRGSGGDGIAAVTALIRRLATASDPRVAELTG